MTTTFFGPLSVRSGGGSNPDAPVPSGFQWGLGLTDPRSPGLVGQQFVEWACGGDWLCVDQAPSTAATANIAALANVTNNTAMTLVSSSAAGITVTTTATTILQTGLVVPSGALAIDGLPGTVNPSQSGNVQIFDPTKAVARCVSISGVSGGAGGNFAVAGYDLYGAPITQTITVAAGANTVNSTKAFKFVTSVTPKFTDAHNYSVGTADIFGFPLRVDRFGYARIIWSDAVITANTGFVAAVTTAASGTTGDTRGTYAVQSSSDGTKRLQVFVNVAVANMTTTAGLVGVTQA